MLSVGNRRANHGMTLGSTIFNVRPGSRILCLSMGRCLTGRHRNATGSGREDRVDNSAHGLNHRGNNNNTHHNSVGSPMLMNNTHMFNPGPHSCHFGLGGGMGVLTHGSTLSCGTRRDTVIVLRSFAFRTPGAGRFLDILGGLGVRNGGMLFILPRSGGGMCLSTHGLRHTRIVLTSGIGSCGILGTSMMIVARGSLRAVSRVLAGWVKSVEV